MAETGSLIVRTYASAMLYPIAGTRVTVTRGEGDNLELIAFRITDENGKTDIIEIDTPIFEESRDQNNREKPFASVDIKVEKEGFDISTIKDVQIFARRLSEQNVEMIPLPENAKFDEFRNVYTVTPQNL